MSLQTKNKGRLRTWKEQVRLSAEQKWPAHTAPVSDEVAIEIRFFYNTDAPDVDNIIKPIQDALVGLVYVDDAQVTHTLGRKSRIDGAFRIKGVSPNLAVALANGDDFVCVRILPGPAHEDLL